MLPFNYLLSTYYMPGTVVDPGGTTGKRQRRISVEQMKRDWSGHTTRKGQSLEVVLVPCVASMSPTMEPWAFCKEGSHCSGESQ